MDYELLWLIAWIIVSFLTSFFSVLLVRKFWKTNYKFSFLLLSASMIFDFVANLFWMLSSFNYGGVENIPYPSFMDILWFIYYLLLGFGVFYYWIKVYREIYDKTPTFWILFIIGCTVSSFFTAPIILGYYNMLSEPIVDILYISLPLFSSLLSIPLFVLFRGGKLSKPWLYMGIGLFSNLCAESLWIMEIALGWDHIFSDILYMVGYISLIIAYWRMNSLK